MHCDRYRDVVMNRWCLALAVALPLCALACGEGAAPSTESGFAAAHEAEVTVNGRVAVPGTKGQLLVFAFAGAGGEVADREAAAVSVVDRDGTFALSLSPLDALTLAFLADGANDGVIDGGDPVCVLTAPELVELHGGDVVTLADVSLNFSTRQASAAVIEVHRAATPANTPTPVPAG
jgi:hypothetical protein